MTKKTIQEQTNELYNEQNDLLTAIDVIAKYEEGDNYRLKSTIRKRVDAIDEICETLMNVRHD